jgi:hypothetical protein
MSHEHAPEYRSLPAPLLRLAQHEAVQRITTADLLAAPPRVTESGRFVGRVDSGGLGSPRFFVGEYRDGRMPAALMLEYGASSADKTSSARVWSLADHRGASPDYRLVHDDSSRGYVTA